MNAADLRVFAAVSEWGNITKAATVLHTVQSNVTARIRRLEEELGVPLFHRHPRGVTLTTAGLRLLPYAIQLGKVLAEAKAVLDQEIGPQGNLSIGALETTAAARLPPTLAIYTQRFPNVDISLHTGTTCSLIDEVLSRRLEGAFVAGPVNHPDLIEETVFSEELVFVLPPASPSLEVLLAKGEANILVLRLGCSYRQRLETILSARGVAKIRRVELGTLEGILGLVSAGTGLSLLPIAAVASAERGYRFSIERIAPNQSRIDTVFIRHRDETPSRALSLFVDLAKSAPRDHRASNEP